MQECGLRRCCCVSSRYLCIWCYAESVGGCWGTRAGAWECEADGPSCGVFVLRVPEQAVRLMRPHVHGWAPRSSWQWSVWRGSKKVVRGLGRETGAGGAFGETGIHVLSWWRGWWLAWHHVLSCWRWRLAWQQPEGQAGGAGVVWPWGAQWLR